MEFKLLGNIQCDQVSDSRALRKFTEKQIHNWIKTRLQPIYKNPITYLVRLKRQGVGHAFDCQIQIQYGNQKWIGSKYKKEIHQALIHCLRQMVPHPITP